MDLGEELNALYTDVLHNRCIFTVKLSKLICHAPKLGIIFYTHYNWQLPLYASQEVEIAPLNDNGLPG